MAIKVTVKNLFQQSRALLLLLDLFQLFRLFNLPCSWSNFHFLQYLLSQYYEHIGDGHSASSVFDLFCRECLLRELFGITGFSYVWFKLHWSYVGMRSHCTQIEALYLNLSSIYLTCQLYLYSTFPLKNITMLRASRMWIAEDCSVMLCSSLDSRILTLSQGVCPHILLRTAFLVTTIT